MAGLLLHERNLSNSLLGHMRLDFASSVRSPRLVAECQRGFELREGIVCRKWWKINDLSWCFLVPLILFQTTLWTKLYHTTRLPSYVILLGQINIAHFTTFQQTHPPYHTTPRHTTPHHTTPHHTTPHHTTSHHTTPHHTTPHHTTPHHTTPHHTTPHHITPHHTTPHHTTPHHTTSHHTTPHHTTPHHTTPHHTTPRQTVPCQPGHYSEGSSSDKKKSGKCKRCPEGSFQKQYASSFCTPCTPSSSFSPAASVDPSACESVCTWC